MSERCPFCSIIASDPEGRIFMQNEQAIAMLDGFPVSKGHVLVIPKQHVASFFEISLAEQSALLDLITQAKRIIDAEHQPDAYNIGINDGSDAGQTVAHLHVHLIPRYHNDVADPRGGVRWIMPDKAVYWDED